MDNEKQHPHHQLMWSTLWNRTDLTYRTQQHSKNLNFQLVGDIKTFSKESSRQQIKTKLLYKTAAMHTKNKTIKKQNVQTQFTERSDVDEQSLLLQVH